MDKKNFDLTILPAKKENEEVKYKRHIDSRLFNCHNGVLMLIVSPPRTGKSNLLLNLFGNSNFLKEYYDNLYLIGATIKNDPTLKPLTDYYNNCYDYLDDSIIEDIIKYQFSQPEADRSNCAIIIDDAMSMPGFEKRGSALQKLTGNYRHITRGATGGGAVIVSTQKIKSCSTSFRCNCNTIILGKISNREELKIIIDLWADTFGGERCFKNMMKYCWKEKYNFMCLYIDGSIENPEPCVYKSFAEKIYPGKFKPDKDFFNIDNDTIFDNVDKPIENNTLENKDF